MSSSRRVDTTVSRSEGIDAFLAPPVTAPPPGLMTTAENPNQGYLHNLRDLLELEDAGDRVIWPPGISAAIARDMIKQGMVPGPGPTLSRHTTDTAPTAPNMGALVVTCPDDTHVDGAPTSSGSSSSGYNNTFAASPAELENSSTLAVAPPSAELHTFAASPRDSAVQSRVATSLDDSDLSIHGSDSDQPSPF